MVNWSFWEFRENDKKKLKKLESREVVIFPVNNCGQ